MPRTNAYGQPIGEEVASFKVAARPHPGPFSGRYSTIEHLQVAKHGQDLFEALYAPSKDDGDWTYMPYERPADKSAFLNMLQGNSDSTDPYFYAILDTDRKAQGMFSYLRVAPDAGSTEIGHIMLGPALQRSRTATEAFFLLMRDAFEGLGNRRLEWKCDSLNARSRRAADRLGFTYEGVFRQCLVYKGRNRDTAWFSVIDKEWPAIKRGFQLWLSDENFDAQGKQRKTLESCRAEAEASSSIAPVASSSLIAPTPSISQAQKPAQATTNGSTSPEATATPLNATVLPLEPRSKPSPSAFSGKQQAGNLHFAYAPSPSGIDSNLLIFLHGLGDNEKPFFQLGHNLQSTLPQTAVLSLRAPKQVPMLMEEEARMWWDSFTPLGKTHPDQNPTEFCEAFEKLLDFLTTTPTSSSSSTATTGCGWAPQHIHLLGFGQGGTAALESAIHWALSRQERSIGGSQRVPEHSALGSVVSISGTLLRHASFTLGVATRVLNVYRSYKVSVADSAVLRRLRTLGYAFGSERLTQCRMPPVKVGPEEIFEAMPRAKEGEWDPIIRWWAETGLWRNRTEMEMRDDGSVMRLA